MKLISTPVLVSLLLCCCLAMGADDARSSKSEIRRRGIFGLGPFRPFMRVLGMMGLPLLPIILLRQLLVGAGAANQQGAGAGAGMGSLGALGLLGPFGAGAGLGGMRPGLGGAAGGQQGFGGLANLLGVGGPAGGAGGGGAGATALFLQKRSTADRLQPLLGALARLERAVDQYDLGAPDCQRRIVCELHRKTIKPSVGSLTEKLIQAFGVEARLERSRFTSNTKAVLKDFLKAARNGLQQRDCAAIYYKCPVAVATTSRSEKNVSEKKTQDVSTAKETPQT